MTANKENYNCIPCPDLYFAFCTVIFGILKRAYVISIETFLPLQQGHGQRACRSFDEATGHAKKLVETRKKQQSSQSFGIMYTLFCIFLLLVTHARGRPMSHVSLRGGQCGVNNLPCLPGIDTLGTGFDILTGTSVGKQQVLDFTYNANQIYVNPFNRSLQYAVPDNVTVRDDTGSSSTLETKTFYTSQEYATSLAVSVSVSASLKVFINAFSASASVSVARKFLSSSSGFGSYSASTETAKLYEVVLPPGMASPKTNIFQTAWQKLPTSYNTSSAPIFENFFSYFGTHYIESAIFGGMGIMTCAVNAGYTNTHSSSETDAQASLHFGFLKSGGSSSSAKDQADTSFTNQSYFSASTVGGDPTLGDLTDWSDWVKTFYNAPAQVAYKLRPITDLISDPGIANAVGDAVVAYAGGYLSNNCTNASETIAGLERRLATTKMT